MITNDSNRSDRSDDDTSIPEVMAMTPSVLEVQSKAEYDVQIATAKRYPRSIDSFLKRAESMATASPEIAAACEYAKPVGKDDDGKPKKVKGPSARLAEMVCATYGNIRVQARIIAVTDSEVIGQGVGHDLETNVAQSTEVRQSILDRKGNRFPEHMIQNVCGSVCSKARRNVTFLIVPVAICLPIIQKARRVAAGDEKTLPERRKALLDWFESKGAKRSLVFAWLGIKAEPDINLEVMADLIAAQNTAKEDEISVADFFGKPRESRFSDDSKPEGAKP